MTQSLVYRSITGSISLLLAAAGALHVARAQTPVQPIMESGHVTIAADTGPGTWVSVSFDNAFPNDDLSVFHLMDNANLDAAALRIRNVSATGFEIAQWEFNSEANAADDNTTSPEITVPWVAAEHGDWTLPSGDRMRVANIAATGTVGLGADTWINHSFGTAFSGTPAIIGAIQTADTETNTPTGPTCPGLTEAFRNVTANGFIYGLDRMQIIDDACYNSVSETVGYMAIDNGANGVFTMSDGEQFLFEAIYSLDVISGSHDAAGNDTNCDVINFVNTYGMPPLVVGTQNTYYGGDGGWVRQCSKTTTGIGLNIDEDQSLDAERIHTTERAGLLVLGKPPQTVTKTVTGLFDASGAVATGTTAYSGYVVAFTLDYDMGLINGTVKDHFDPASFTFLDVPPAYDSTDPDANYLFDVDGDSVNEQVIEWNVNAGAGTIDVFMTIN